MAGQQDAGSPAQETPAPRVSVVMIFLDEGRYIDEAIASVMAQTLQDFELLLCDDGSTDESTVIAKNWAARHPGQIRYLEHPGHENRGMSATRNLGLAAARGEFVGFIDADDAWRPRKLAEQVAVLDAHPELALVAGTVCLWHSWSGGEDELMPVGHVRNRVVHPPEASLAVYPLGSSPAPCMEMLLRREAVESVGGLEASFTGLYEDQAFLSKLYLDWPVYFSDAVWLDYRQHPESCVASTTREGRYHELRHGFLTWLEGYLDDRTDGCPEPVRVALTRALRPYRRPVLHAVVTGPRRAIAKGRRTLERLSAASDPVGGHPR